MKEKVKNYIIILLYGIVLIILLVGLNRMYGSNIDWLSQHSVIPDYFRKLFYETGRFLPNFAFNIGGGQNIFNYAYYGLLSPVILISYLLPKVSMTAYIVASSVILYLMSGEFIYYFLKNHFDKKIALVLAISFITLAPLSFNFHHHIMFVWYIPFLILSLIAVDRYLKKNKSLFLMISIFLMIMTNYYYSVGGLLVVMLYGVYRLFDQELFDWKIFIKKLLASSIRIIIPILISSIIIVPTAYVIFKSNRLSNSSNLLYTMFLFNPREIFYENNGLGITVIMLMGPISLLCLKQKKYRDKFIGLSLLIITLIPLFMYLMNGSLYIRGKVLIPLTVLYIYVIAKFNDNLLHDRVNIKKVFVCTSIILLMALLYLIIDGTMIFMEIAYIIDFLLSIFVIKKVIKKRNPLILPIVFLAILFSITIVNNHFEDYVTFEEFDKINDKDVTSLVNNINDTNLYRMDNYNYSLDTANRVYRNNYYNTSIYSSNYNDYYWQFYHKEVGNNIPYRNVFVTAGSNNLFFNRLMGVKYIINNKDIGLGYQNVSTVGNLNLYQNDDVLPIIYAKELVGTYEDYRKLKYPYNLEYMLNNSVTNGKNNLNYRSSIEKIKISEDNYDFKLLEEKSVIFPLSNPINKKVLIVSFDMNYNQACSEGDIKITINGITNTLTCKEWIYHNQNYHFNYVISSNEEIKELVIKFSKGTYKIANIKTYLMEDKDVIYNDVTNILINKPKSVITFETNFDKDNYIITSIPYDESFNVYVDGKLIEKEIVNTAFLGFKISSSKHEVKITYNSLGLKQGLIISLIGLIMMFGLIISESLKNSDKLH